MPSVDAARLPTSPRRHRLRVAWTAFAVGAILLVGWPVAAIVNWEDIVNSHARLGYLIGDVGLVVPLAFATWYSLRHQAWWGPYTFLLLAGAGAFDSVHFAVYLWQTGAFGVPGYLYGVAAAVALVVIVRWVARAFGEVRPR
jgi:hypothetical protein